MVLIIGGVGVLFIIGTLIGIADYNRDVAANKTDHVTGSGTQAPTARARTEDDWDRGYNLGYGLGRLSGLHGDRVPRDEDLRTMARNVSIQSDSIHDKDLFERAFRSGFESGYKQATKPAF